MSVISQSAMFVSRRMAAFVAGIAFACACALAFALPGAANAETGNLAVGSSSLSAQASISIPKSAARYKGHYYKIYYYSENSTTTWTAAKAACAKVGGHLATITSSGEQAFIDKLNGSEDKLWLGGYATKGRVWKWVTGEKWRYENWSSGQPDNNDGSEDKLGTFPVQWNDYMDSANAGEMRGYICEWDYSLSLSDSKLVLDKGDKTYVTYSAKGPSGALSAKPTWSTSNKNVAKVSSKGMVVAMRPGSCNVTCKVAGMSRTVKVVVKPTKVTGVKALSKGRGFIQLKWSKQAGVSSYQIYFYDADIEEFALAKTVNGSLNTVRITGLSKNTAYKFKVRGVVKASKAYQGEFSKVVLVRTTK